MIRYSSIVLFLLTSVFLQAQLNIKVAYSLGYTPASSNAAMVSAFNEENDFRLEQSLRAIHLMYGIHIGARYKFGDWAVDLSWESLLNNAEGVGEDPASSSLFRKELFYGNNTLAIGLESHYGFMSIGCSLGSRNFSVKTNLSGSEVKRSLLTDRQWVARPYLSFNFEGSDIIGLSIQPFVQIPLSIINLDPVSNFLWDEQSSAPAGIEERFMFYGISLTFYNGWQGR